MSKIPPVAVGLDGKLINSVWQLRKKKKKLIFFSKEMEREKTRFRDNQFLLVIGMSKILIFKIEKLWSNECKYHL